MTISAPNVRTAIIITFSLLFPVFFLPFTPDTHEYNKLALLVITDLLLLLVLAWDLIAKRQLLRNRRIFDAPLALLALLCLLSTFIQSPNPFIPLLTPLSSSTILAGILLFFLLTTQNSKLGNRALTEWWIIPTVCIAIFVLSRELGLISFSVFTPAGNILASATFLAIGMIYLSLRIWEIGKTRAEQPHVRSWMICYLVSLSLIATATGFLIHHLLVDLKPIILPPITGLTILRSTAGHIVSLLMGVGPGHFLTAFTLEKTAAINRTPMWNMTFTTSSSFFLTLVTEMGIIAGLCYVWVFFLSIIRSLTHFSATNVALLAAFLVQIALPGSMPLFLLTIVLLVVASHSENVTVSSAPVASWISWGIAGMIGLFVLMLSWLTVRAYTAEVLYARSLIALQQTKGKEAYDLQAAAIEKNPLLDKYYIAFSQTNLVLAKAIASKQNPTAEENAILPVLIRQSIDSGKQAIARARTNPASWNNLGGIYAELLSFADDADRAAIDSYSHAKDLDPANPLIRLSLAHIYLQEKKYTDAAQYIQDALTLKPDLAAAYIARARLHRVQNQIPEARAALEMAKQLSVPNTPEAQTIDQEMKLIEGK